MNWNQKNLEFSLHHYYILKTFASLIYLFHWYLGYFITDHKYQTLNMSLLSLPYLRCNNWYNYSTSSSDHDLGHNALVFRICIILQSGLRTHCPKDFFPGFAGDKYYTLVISKPHHQNSNCMGVIHDHSGHLRFRSYNSQ